MKTIHWVFAIAVFVVSLAQPAFASGCGQNAGRYTSTTAPRPSPAPPAPNAGVAQGAGMAR